MKDDLDLADATQALYAPLRAGSDMLVLMVRLDKQPDGSVVLHRPFLDDIEAASLALAGRNYSLEERP